MWDLRDRPAGADRPRSDRLRSRRRSDLSAGADGDGAVGAGGGSRGSQFRQARLRFDAGLPQPIAHYRHGISAAADEIVSTGIMDQHCMLRLAPGSDVQVGDILLFGTSHPCLTFDKWKTLLLVDDDYNVLEELDTCSDDVYG
jgi:hypothetical protein